MIIRAITHALVAVLIAGAPALAQQASGTPSNPPAPSDPPAIPALPELPEAAEEPKAEPAEAGGDAAAQPPFAASIENGRTITMQHFRPQDRRGINVFETPKAPGVDFKGFHLDFGAAFTSQLQALSHSNSAAPRVVDGVDVNKLADIGTGFNTANANLYLHAQLARGVRVQLSTYLSSRHHNETWVKDGFLLVDASPVDIKPLNTLMQYVTLKVGHFEINYGDAHFRRTDNGNALYNPFIGNYIMEAFTTEIGAELYVRRNGFLAMGSVTGGEIRGTVLSPDQRGLTYIGKLGFDRQLSDDLRVRLTGSMYTADKSLNNTLYSGDRAGSRYYYVLENTAATESAQFTSGLVNPGLRNSVTAFMVNPFVKKGGVEFFGTIERASGRSATEASDRTWHQYAGDVVYRFMPDETMFVGARYNVVEGRLPGTSDDVRINRVQLGAGWFVMPGLLVKAEYVTQKYFDFPVTDIRHGGKFNGMMLEGVVAF